MVIQYESLESLCDVIDPHPSHRAPKPEPIGIPFLGIGDFDSNGSINLSKARIVNEKVFDEHKQRYSLQDDLLVFGRVASIGKVVELPKTDEKFVISPTLAVLKPKAIDLKYLKYAVQSPCFMRQMHEMSTGSTRKSVGMKNLRKAIVPTFPINEQKRIVAILDQAFADIDKARILTEQNLKNTRELFESYLQFVFSQRGKGWVEKKLREVCVLQRGFDLPKRLRAVGEYPLVSSSGVIDSNIEAKVCGPGVVTGRSGSIGKVFFIEEDFWPLNTTLYIKEFHNNDRKFVSWLLRHFDLNRYTSGAGVPTLNRNFVHDEVVTVPTSIEDQKNIVEGIERLESELARVDKIYDEKLNKLDELKKSLLQKAFSGELTKDKQEAA